MRKRTREVQFDSEFAKFKGLRELKFSRRRRCISADSIVGLEIYTENEEPQPQVVCALGFRITNCAPSRPSE